MTDKTNDTLILELSIRILSNALNDLVACCLDERGTPKTPTIGEISRARGYLPEYCKMAFKKVKK